MVILIGGGGEPGGVGWKGGCGGGLLTSLSFPLLQSSRVSPLRSQSLPVSGNTAILNGFPVLHLRPPPHPSPLPCPTFPLSHLLVGSPPPSRPPPFLPALFSLEPPPCAVHSPPRPTNQYSVPPPCPHPTSLTFGSLINYGWGLSHHI